MRSRATRRRSLPLHALTLLVLASLLAAPALAQVPDLPEVPSEPPHAEYNQLALQVDSAFVEVPYMGRGTVSFTIRDLSRDSTRQPGATDSAPASGPAPHPIYVTMEPACRSCSGWTASTTLSAAFLFGGESITGEYFVQTGGRVLDQFTQYYLNATMILRNGSEIQQSELITARLLPFYRGFVQIQEPSRNVGQYEYVHFGVEVTNNGAYPDTFLLNVTVPPGYQAHIDHKVYVEPFETRVVNLTLKTPKDKLYDFGSSHTVTVNMRSANDPTNYQSVASLYVRGGYMSKAYYPLLLLGVVALGVVVQREREDRELKRLERGRPRRPEPTPRTAVVMKEMKRRDPDAYKERRARFAAVYKSRRELYRDHRKDAMRGERAQRRAARLEAKEERKARKRQRKADKQEAKIEAKRLRAVRKQTKKRKRVLLKQKRKLEKQRAKLAKKQAKVDARDAKKRAKEDAKRAKQEAREAKKRAKAEKKVRKGGR